MRASGVSSNLRWETSMPSAVGMLTFASCWPARQQRTHPLSPYSLTRQGIFPHTDGTCPDLKHARFQGSMPTSSLPYSSWHKRSTFVPCKWHDMRLSRRAPTQLRMPLPNGVYRSACTGRRLLRNLSVNQAPCVNQVLQPPLMCSAMVTAAGNTQ